MKAIIFMVLAVLCSTSHFSLLAQEHQHHHEQQDAELVLNHGEKWSIDASLHLGMTRIKDDLKQNLDLIHYDKFTHEQFNSLALKLDRHLSFLFENCKLEPKADAQLHILLARIMSGVDTMKHADNKKPGAVAIIKALQDYPKYFNDANWQPIVH